MIATIVAAALLQAAVPSSGATSPGNPGASFISGKPTPSTLAGGGKVLCRIMIPLGSHVGHNECMTKSEWSKFDTAVAQAHARGGDMAGGQGVCLPNEPCRNGPGG